MAHAGDSGAIMACLSDDLLFPLRLTSDHKPNRPDEHARITRAGGGIDKERDRVVQEKPFDKRVTMLNMSRCKLFILCTCLSENHPFAPEAQAPVADTSYWVCPRSGTPSNRVPNIGDLSFIECILLWSSMERLQDSCPCLLAAFGLVNSMLRDLCKR